MKFMAEEPSRYQKMKKWYKEHKKEITVAFCFVLMFFVGFGTGRYDKESQKLKLKKSVSSSEEQDYKSNAGNRAEWQNAAVNTVNNNDDGQRVGERVLGAEAEQTEGFAPAADGKCPIKGNINVKGKKVYHIPTGAFYNQTKPERCFNTESEAKRAGFVKSAR